MDFRRSGQLDERRRRVLMDEIASPSSQADNSEAAAPLASSAKGPVRAYSPAVLAERQPRVSDFVPVRPFAVLFLILIGLTGVAAIETIYIYLATLPLASAAEYLAAFDVGQPGSLASYYSALVLAVGVAGALVIYGIRSHRVDDYRGHYRIWLWSAAALALASLDAATGLHDALGVGVATLFGQALEGAGGAAAVKIGWLVIYGLVFGTLAVRAAIEVWPSLPSFASLAVTGLLYLVAGMLLLGMFQAASPLVNSVAASTAIMLAHVALASAVGLYARHVHLDAQGRLKVYIDPDRKKGKKPKSRARLKVVKEDKADDEQPDFKPAAKSVAAVESARPATAPRFGWGSSNSSSNSSSNPPPKAAASVSKPVTSGEDDDDNAEDEDDAYGNQKLSRSERKRLKKLARQQQRRAA